MYAICSLLTNSFAFAFFSMRLHFIDYCHNLMSLIHQINSLSAMSFTNSTFGCFNDVPQCLDTMCCFCCQVGRQCNAIDGVASQHNCVMCIVGLVCASFMGCCLRCKVSDKYQLGEGALSSCICGTFCGPCSVCMTGRELNDRGTNPGGFLCSSAPRTAPEMKS